MIHHRDDFTSVAKNQKTYRRLFGMIFFEGSEPMLATALQSFATQKIPKNHQNSKANSIFISRNIGLAAKTPRKKPVFSVSTRLSHGVLIANMLWLRELRFVLEGHFFQPKLKIGGAKLCRAVTFFDKTIQGSTETEQHKSGPLCGLSRPTVEHHLESRWISGVAGAAFTGGMAPRATLARCQIAMFLPTVCGRPSRCANTT